MVSSYLPIIIDNTIENLGLSCVALEKGLDISDQDLADEIRNAMPNLVNPQGEFDRRSYEMGVQRMGYTVPMFEERMKQQMLLKRMQDLATEGIYVAEPDVRKEYERRNVKIKLEYATVTPASLAGSVTPTDEEVQQLYKSSPAKYNIPAKREYTVVYADQEKIGTTMTVADDRLRSEYARQADRFRMPERAKVRHILILTQGLNDAQKKTALEKIQGIQKRAKGGEDFSQTRLRILPKTPAPKDKGGEYDFTPRNGTWVKPFEDAAFTQPIGQVGDIVTTDFGYHVIKVEAREAARMKPFEEVKGSLANEVQSVAVQEAMQKAIDAARAEAIKNPSQLTQIAEKYHLDVFKSGGKLQVQPADARLWPGQ